MFKAAGLRSVAFALVQERNFLKMIVLYGILSTSPDKRGGQTVGSRKVTFGCGAAVPVSAFALFFSFLGDRL